MVRLSRFVSDGLVLLMIIGASGCGGDNFVDRLLRRQPPLEVPVLITVDLPFRYPPGLYLQRIQGDVMLRLYIDSLGAVVAESTKIVAPSPEPQFDSAALEGAVRLTFHPARRGERRVGTSVLFPVKFRMPTVGPADSSHEP